MEKARPVALRTLKPFQARIFKRDDNIMKHVNFVLAHTARSTISNHLRGTRHRLVFGPLLRDEQIEDTGEFHDATQDCMIEHMLDDIVPQSHGYKHLRQVLQDALLTVATEHTVRPTKVVDTFLKSLRCRSLQDFLRQPDDTARKRHERRVRSGLDNLGFALRRSKKRDPLRDSYGLYHVIHRPTNSIIVDVPCDLDGIERWIRDVRVNKRVYDDLPTAAD
jgi:hypothetical protein